MTKSTKFFLYTFISSIVFYGILRLAGTVFDIDTNIDTGNPVMSTLYYIDYALGFLSAIGLVLAVIWSAVKR